MSNSVTLSNEEPTRRLKTDEEVLPQWAIDAMRPAVWLIARAFCGLKIRGLQHIPSKDGLIIAANHQSYVDPFLIGLPIQRPIRFLAWNVAFGWPVIGKAMRLLGAWPLQLEGSDPAAIRRAFQWLRSGKIVVIFPEGGRGQPDGSMNSFKAGAVRIAMEAGVPILPVTIRGANRVWPAGKRLPRFGKVEIVYHPPYRPRQQNGEDTRICARRESERLAAIIGSAL